MDKKDLLFEEKDNFLTSKTIFSKRISKTVTGGRRMSLTVGTVVGNGDGMVGVGHGKAMSISEATIKSNNMANKKMVQIDFDKNLRTIFGVTKGKCCSTEVILFPKRSSSGVNLGSSARSVVEQAGISNISGKIISGKGNPLNIAVATIKALLKQNVIKNLKKVEEC